MNKILEVTNLKKYYHTPKEEILALDDISFDLDEGEFISIVGPSGCGKSTILSILSNLIDKSSGSITVNNKSIAYMLQSDSLLPYLTILDNALIGLKVTRKLTEENKEYVINLLKTYGLGDFLDKYPSSLSGGMRQRVALIRTLAVKPDILLLDEATSALDYQSSLIISEDIYNILKKENKTLIMVTHDISLAISMSDRVVVLSKRPSVVKNIYDIKLNNKSTPINNRKDKDFSKYYEMIWRDLDVHI
ncbi:MAG: ABC transporter ATP-binding protein [Bacilli bacterium]|nr:ABC transporter ATP-binding protein [Bacilli bacterium]